MLLQVKIHPDDRSIFEADKIVMETASDSLRLFIESYF
jgi:hypothetical protein